MEFDKATTAVIRVGEGRGFVMAGEGPAPRFIITAAHCLPFFPPCPSDTHDRTYRPLLAPLDHDPAIRAECLFCDLIADIAVLGVPDGQEPEYHEDSLKYNALVDAVTPFKLSAGPSRLDAQGEAHGPARLLSLDRRWFDCQVVSCYRHGPWMVTGAEPIRGGMSGSPIVAVNGAAIGVVCIGTLDIDEGGGFKNLNSGGPNPRLTENLPGWLLSQWGQWRRLTARERAESARKTKARIARAVAVDMRKWEKQGKGA